MSVSSIEALASAWAQIAEEAEFPADYEGTATPAAHRASEAIQERIREHIVATNDMRLFGLLHLLGQASLRMEQALWPEDYERLTREVEEALREANDPSAKLYTHEEVMQAMQERIDQARDKYRVDRLTEISGVPAYNPKRWRLVTRVLGLPLVGGIALRDVELGVAQVTDARREAEAQQVHQCEHVIGEARRVGVVLLDAQIGFVV
jgi:DNA gyrase/topoisomerase IV subunit A